MKTAQWYYKEMDKVERKIKNSKDESEKKELEQYLDKLNDDLYDLK